MRTLGNILWHFPFLGFLSAFMTFVFGALMVLLVVTAPIGRGLIQYSKFLLAPYTRKMIRRKDMGAQSDGLWNRYESIVGILWLPFGLFLALMVAIQVGLVFISIIGIPVAVVLAKSIGTYLNPVGKLCVEREVAEELAREKAQQTISAAREGAV
ncbi:YccF domain-containing protein [Lentisalinibacter orientalis]|uniref:YccF domain-containing protein n=1 Tax=Lentisalinibacter orientalis TaxID=2992241 RepID=UPI00386428E1